MDTTRKALCAALALASAALASGASRAQDEYGFEDESAPAPRPAYDNYVEIGIGHTEDGNGKFGEYTSDVNDAFQDDGPFGVGGLRWSGRDADAARAWQVELGTGSARLLTASYEVQGDFAVGLYGDRLKRTEYGEAGLVYPGGGDTLLLPAGFVPGTSTRDSRFYDGEDIASTRETIGLDASKHVADNWTFSVNIENQDKDGEQILGGNQGFSGTAMLPAPVDYNTELMTARAEYATSCLQNALELHLSKFEGGDDSVVFQNAQYAGTAAYPLGLAEIDLPPDNEFLRLGVDGGYSFDALTRLSWFADWSRGEQDENFQPLHIDPGFYPSIDPAFPQRSLDGEVERSSLKLALVGRPFARFDYRVQYDYRDRDTQHDAYPVLELSYQPDAAASGFSSRVYDKETQRFAVEGGYRFAGRLRLRGGYEYEAIDRDTDEFDPLGVLESFTDATTEDRYWAELKLPEIGALSTKLRAEYSTIDPDLSHQTEEFISPGGIGRRATPFFLLERTQDVYEIDLDYALGTSASVYFSWKSVRDDFDNDTYGLDSRDSDIGNLGFSWSPAEALSLSAYLSREEYDIRQTGRQMGATAVPYSEWRLVSEDDGDAYGVSLDWAVIADRFDIAADLAFVETDSTYVSSPLAQAGVALTTGATPDVNDELLRLNVVGTYRWNERVELSGRYIWERRDAEDWGWDTLLTPAAATTASAIGFTYQRPDYDASAVIVALRYRF